MGFPAIICDVCEFWGHEECVSDAEIDDAGQGADAEGERGEIEIRDIIADTVLELLGK
jgi:hypothetical protein